jgi:hypothetical protein
MTDEFIHIVEPFLRDAGELVSLLLWLDGGAKLPIGSPQRPHRI